MPLLLGQAKDAGGTVTRTGFLLQPCELDSKGRRRVSGCHVVTISLGALVELQSTMPTGGKQRWRGLDSRSSFTWAGDFSLRPPQAGICQARLFDTAAAGKMRDTLCDVVLGAGDVAASPAQQRGRPTGGLARVNAIGQPAAEHRFVA